MINIKNFSKSYNNKVIVENVSFIVKDNKINFFMGNNGAGKTTFFKCLSGLETYDGDIFFHDDMDEDLLVIWDDTPFYNDLTGIQNLQILGESKHTLRDIYDIAIKYLSIEKLKCKVKLFSYGEKKRLALAFADILHPKYLLMDEITNGLDYQSIKELKEILVSWSTEMTVLLTGHHFEFYDSIIDDLYLFKGNRILPVLDFKNEAGILERIYDKELS